MKAKNTLRVQVPKPPDSGKVTAKGKGASCETKSEGSRRQTSGLTNGNPLHLLRHPHCKRGSVGGQDRTKVEFGGCLTRKKLAVNAELLWGNCILAMKNRQKIRPKRPETDMKLKF